MQENVWRESLQRAPGHANLTGRLQQSMTDPSAAVQSMTWLAATVRQDRLTSAGSEPDSGAAVQTMSGTAAKVQHDQLACAGSKPDSSVAV